MKNTLGLLTLSAGLAIAGCGDDGNTGGSPQGGNPSGGSAQGAGPQGAGSQGGDGPVAGQPQGGTSQGGDGQGGDGNGGTSQGGNGGAGQGGDGGAGQGGDGGAGQGGDGGAGGSAPLTCQTGCEALFDCGLENDSGGNQNCPGIQASDGPLFIPGCVQQCMSQMALLSIIDPNDCEGTIDTLSALSSDFENFCENGI